MHVSSLVSRKKLLLGKKISSAVLFLALLLQPLTPSILTAGFFIPVAAAQSEEESNADALSESEEENTLEKEQDSKENEEAKEETSEEKLPQPEVSNMPTEVSEEGDKESPKENPASAEETTFNVDKDGKATLEKVELNKTYVAPQNKDVTVTFTKLPETPGSLSIEELTLTQAQVAETGALSDKAYDITSSMENGSFEYELTLPIPEGEEGIAVKYAENTEKLLSEAKSVETENIEVKEETVKAELDHFTIFVVTGVNNTGACPGSGLFVITPGDKCYTSLELAVANAENGDTIEVRSNITLTNSIVVDKILTIKGIGSVTVTTSGGNQLLTIVADGVKIENLNFNKTDKTSQHFIGVQSSNVTIKDNEFTGQFINGEGDVTRALVVSGGLSGLVVSGNTFTNLRQPAYINNGASGSITENYVTGTRGWVVEKASTFSFSGNSWGTNSNGTIPLDIAIIPGVDPASTPNNYTCQIPAIKSANNNANIQDQYPSTISCPDILAPTVPGQIGWTTENPPVGNDYTNGSDFSQYATCGMSVNYSPMTNLWGPSTDASGPVLYEREVYSPENILIYSPTLSTNYEYGDGAVNGQTYWVRVRAVDVAGNKSAWTSKCSITYDATAPDSPVHESPADNSFLTNNTFTFQWTDVSGAVEYEFQSATSPAVDGNGVLTTGVWNNKIHGGPDRNYLTESEILSYGANGTWYWQVRARDAAGNWSAWTNPWKITIDMVAPEAPQFTTVSETGGDAIPNGGLTNSYGVNINWTAVSDATSYEYRYWNDIPGNAYNAPNYYIASNLTNTTLYGEFNQGDGIHHFQVRAKDEAGNFSSWSTQFDVIYDGTKGTTVVLSPIDTGIYSSNSPFDITIRSTDLESGLVKAVANLYGSTGLIRSCVNETISPAKAQHDFVCTINPSSLGGGDFYIKTNGHDAAGNVTNTVTWNFRIDFTAPSADIVFLTPGPSATSFQVVFSEDVNESEAENGANYFLNNWPGAGGSGDLLGDVSITYDSSTKTATLQMTNPGWYVSPEQEWGVQNIHDLAGNLQIVSPYKETSTPLVAPVTTDSGTSASWQNAPVTVTFTCDDGPVTSGSGCKTTYYTTDGSTPTTASPQGNSVTITAEGETTIKYFSVDFAGNTESMKTAANTVKIDTTAPLTPTNLSPSDGTFRQTSGDGINKTDWSDVTDPNGVTYFYESSFGTATNSDGSFVTKAYGPDDLTLSEIFNPGEPEGTYYWHVQACDGAGNCSAWSPTWSINIDNTTPFLVGTTEFGDGWYSTNQTATFTYNDNFGIVSGTPVTCEITTEGAGQTCSVATVNVCDAAGNCNAAPVTSDGANIDKSTENLTYSMSPATPDGDDNWYVTSPIVTLSASDSLSGVDRIEYRLNGGVWVTYTTPFGLSDNSSWTIDYRYFDAVGNEKETGSAFAKVDTTDPDEVNDLDAEYREDRDDIKLDWNVDNADIDQVYIYRGGSEGFNTSSANRKEINNANDETYDDGDVELGETYYYKLISEDEAGNRSGSNTIRVAMPDEEGGEVVVTPLGTGAGGDDTDGGTGGDGGEVAGAETTTTGGESGTDTGEGEVLGATDQNGEGNAFLNYVKENPWWMSLWLLLLLILGYIGYRRFARE